MSDAIDPISGEVYPVAERAPQLPAVRQPFTGWESPDGVFTNIPRTAEMIPLLVNASSTPDYRAKQITGKMLEVEYFYAHQVVRENSAAGTRFLGWRCVLITTDGKLIVCSGPAVIRAVELLCSIYGHKPWKPAIVCEIVANSGKDGHEYHTLKVHPTKIPAAQPVNTRSR